MKFWNYAVISLGLALLFEFAGIDVGQGILNFFFITRDGINLTSSVTWVKIGLITVGAALAIGTLTRTSPENYIIWPIIIASTAVILGTFIGIANAAKNYAAWVRYPSLFIMAILSVGFAISVYEHFRGTD